MPIIHFDGPSLSKEKKAELVAKLTASAHEVLATIPKQAFTVVIRENGPENIGVGGELLADRKQ